MSYPDPDYEPVKHLSELHKYKIKFSRIQPKKDFSLDTTDIEGAGPRNLKYKDRGVKKADFFNRDNN